MNAKSQCLLSVVVLAAALCLSDAIPVGAGTRMGLPERQAVFEHALRIAKIALGPETISESKRSNAELINGLVGMDLAKLNSVGKRSNAELINGLLGMNLGKLNSAGK